MAIIVFLLVLSILIFVHEFGHFLAARRVGIKVEEFAFGLPFTKPLISRDYKGIKLSIYPVLFGGFVKLYGEDPTSSDKISDSAGGKSRKSEAFFEKTKLQRTFVILAGVAMNFLLAIIIISFIFTQGVLVPTKNVWITKVLPNSPAQTAGLKENDFITAIDGKKITGPDELIYLTQKKLGRKIILTISRTEIAEVLGGAVRLNLPTTKPISKAKKVTVTKTLTIAIIPRINYPKNEGPMGIGISNLEVKKLPLWQAPIYGTLEALNMSWLIVKEFGLMIWNLVTLSKTPKDIAGPIGVAQLTGEAVKFGYLAVLQLLGLLSLNLAVINILPIPALDGGRLLFIFLEGIFGRKIKPVIEQTVNNIGMAILLTLILIISINDLNRILNFSQLFSKIVGSFK